MRRSSVTTFHRIRDEIIMAQSFLANPGNEITELDHSIRVRKKYQFTEWQNLPAKQSCIMHGGIAPIFGGGI